MCSLVYIRVCPITTLCFYCHMCPSCPMSQANSKTFTPSPMCPTCAKLWWRLWTYMVLISPEGLLILYRSGLFAIDTSIVNCQKCQRHRDDLEVYWKRQKRTYRSPWFILLRFMRNFQETYRHQHYSFWLKSRPFLPVGAGKNLINC
jgi:hypothetical protein